MTWQAAVLTAYVGLLSVLCVFGLHRARLALVALRVPPRVPPPDPDVWPRVTVQLPLYNERYVAERLIAATGALDYPRDRLELQILDDSTDDTTALAAQAVARLRDQGVDAVLLHRSDRRGFKAGALAEGLKVAKGDRVAIFDADFVPEPDFLRRAVPWLEDPHTGLVQARWGHLNGADGWLTAAQATMLDGHFVVEHGARHALGRWFNFNGTAGVWKKEAIASAGGWSADTLTEDLDLSYRAQLAGWRFAYVDDLVAPAELPATFAAFKSQQHRWARGSVQTAKKLLGRIWRSEAPFGTKVEATFHLAANAGYPLALGLAVLLPLAVVARGRALAPELLALDLALFVAATGSVALFYGVAVRGDPARIVRFPLVFALGLGMAVHQTRAVVEGLIGEVGTFVRTPKQGSSRAPAYRVRVPGLVVVEIALAAWLSGAVLYAMSEGYWASVPFLALFAGGYAAVGLGSLREAIALAASARSAGPQVAASSHEGSVQLPSVGSNPSSTR
jgi:cellulose synthase/poly-beta-1,6-N-acetylglucosamine synthase-like glycosyltransferase